MGDMSEYFMDVEENVEADPQCTSATEHDII